MKKLSAVLFSLFGLFSVFSYANEGIEVIGKASVEMQPDQFSLTIRIKERGHSASKTKALVDHKSELITQMFIKEGINASAIDSSQVSMYPIYEKPNANYQPTEIKTRINDQDKVVLSAQKHALSNEQQVSWFDVGRTITVSFSEWSIYDKVLDKVVKLGVSHISPMEMSFQNAEKIYQQALFQAIANAKSKAAEIAQQAGVQLGSLTSLKETSHFAPVMYRMVSEASVGFNSTTTKKAVSAQVIAIYQIAP